ncbi:conserved hypothetical protein [Hyphomicrobiales bacterium]|nr:conserved hypothetical protein [Hyphomicrobiales bacterium]CAH1702970.1 conserved hypothetical protein [Hyphomicrobiales bacterium]CAI0347156.1 conserved hypothetical protein [Hyphomicrobiales bacterium]
MTIHIDFKDKIEAADIADAGRRKNVFRAMAKDFLLAKREGVITDGPGSIARMMEQAYKAGLAGAKLDLSVGPAASSAPARVTEIDLPATSRESLSYLRRHLFDAWAIEDIRHLPEPGRLFVFKRPQLDGLAASLTRDEWLVYWLGDDPRGVSNKAFLPMIRAGLFEYVRGVLRGGWDVVRLTERGYELLRTGDTCSLEGYRPGTTRTAREWAKIAPPEDKLPAAVYMAGVAYKLIKPEPNAEPAPRL